MTSYYDSDRRTQLLLRARTCNGMEILVEGNEDWGLMRQMEGEELFTYSNDPFSRGFWCTPAGRQAVEDAWEQVSVLQFETSYRGHPQVCFSLNGYKEELCYVVEPNWDGSSRGLWVREVLEGRWLIDHPNGQETVPFGSADEAIAWALEWLGEF